ncbi:uncharacterized protein NEMAJ01_0631 [Nematocida major]|uniref:uncharacterized protein n=1 Tax=Nematocida major TaxID=1912982 RepID=UPI002007A511|nr:uncharacterized protein NEMAJ01_0631 [Nematocida major]KAH9385735.1 hypothetical protein NEMAJ01_0631 [Nematocida major]
MKTKRLSIINTHAEGSSDGYLMQSESTSILFDPPSCIFEDALTVSRGPNKSFIQVEVLKEYPAGISGIFITSSNSLAVFFTESNVPIYLTEPVYTQMKERLKHYVSLGPVSQQKRMPQAHTKIVEVSSYRKIARRVVLIKYHQIVSFTYLSVTPQPAGIFLGCPMYVISQGLEKVCAYTYGVPGGTSLSPAMPFQSTQIPLIVNVFAPKGFPDMQSLTRRIENLARPDRACAITMDTLNQSLEMALHILSVVRNRRILVSHKGMKRLMQLYDVKKEVFASRFTSESSVISTLFATNRLRVADRTETLEAVRSEPVIVLCDPSEYSLFYSGIPAVHMHQYRVRFLGDVGDAFSQKWPLEVFSNRQVLQRTCPQESLSVREITEREFHEISESALHSIKIYNTETVHRVARSEEGISLYFAGSFGEDQAGPLLQCRESVLTGLMNESASKRYTLDGVIICNGSKKVYTIKEEGGFVHVKKETPNPHPAGESENAPV